MGMKDAYGDLFIFLFCLLLRAFYIIIQTNSLHIRYMMHDHITNTTCILLTILVFLNGTFHILPISCM